MIIPNNEIADGISLCQDNVDRLLVDAYYLDLKGSPGHALAFVILAMEEYAKKLVLIASAISHVESGAALRGAFTKHDFKLKWVVREVLKALPDSPKSVREFEEAVERLAKTLLELKNTCLYVDYRDETGWIDPNRPNVKGGVQYQANILRSLMKRIEPWLSDERLVKFFM
jgi:AbiV family abortive infection protein